MFLDTPLNSNTNTPVVFYYTGAFYKSPETAPT